MKFIVKQDVKQGQMLPNAWLAFGKHYLRGGYLQINIPLFRLMWGKRPDAQMERFGWYIPSVRILYSNHDIILSWWFVFHSDFMGEEKNIPDFFRVHNDN